MEWLVALFAIENRLPATLDSVVMLGPPNRGSDLVTAIQDYESVNNIIEYFPKTEQLLLQLSPDQQFYRPQNQALNMHVKYGIIAGTKTLNPLFSKLIAGVDDGKVSVGNTCMSNMTDWLAVAENHTTLMFSKQVVKQIKYFLMHHTFDKTNALDIEVSC